MGQKHFLLILEVLAICRQDHDPVVVVECHGHHRALHHRRHEHRNRRHISRERLERHHEAAVAGDATGAPHLQPLDGSGELLLHLVGHHATPRHLDGEPRHAPVDHLVVVAARTVDVARRGGVVVVQADDAQNRRLLLRELLHLLRVRLALRLRLPLRVGPRRGLLPLLLPVINAEAGVVLVAADVEVGGRDCIPDRKACRGSQGVRVGRQLRALQEDADDSGVLAQEVHGHLDDARLHDVDGHGLAFGDGVEAGDVLATLDDESALVQIESTTVEQDIFLRLQRVAVGRQDEDLLLGIERSRDDGALHHRRHEDRSGGNLPCQRLEGHHKTAVAGNGVDTLLLQELDPLGEASFHFLRELALLSHLQGHAGDHAVGHVIAEAGRAIQIALGRWVVAVQADHA
mmetsp:Transcript_47731/g.136819  ORF Transcript_47731/g.136819 Transcript_47731/m.136819 type:complete len:403 (+) Transcript_47731:641-1849(+)